MTTTTTTTTMTMTTSNSTAVGAAVAAALHGMACNGSGVLLVVGCSSKSKPQWEATLMVGERSLEKMDSSPLRVIIGTSIITSILRASI